MSCIRLLLLYHHLLVFGSDDHLYTLQHNLPKPDSMDEGRYETKFLACTGEYADAYTPGGFHPILIGDELDNGKYKIIHKLGHGGSATVWLARDMHQERYVAIKVLQAVASKFANEIAIQQYLSKDSDFACAAVAKIRGRFFIRGINGRHVCLVLDVHGPSLYDLAGIKFRPDQARDIARQIAEAISFLHRNDVAFGDLSPSNLLLDCIDFSSFSAEALYESLGEPVAEEVMCIAKDKTVVKHAPTHIYGAVNFASKDLGLLKPRIVLADLNEAVHITSPATRLSTGYHEEYASPELVFGINRYHTKASDIWALALIFFEIRCRDFLCYGLDREAGQALQRLIGPPSLDFLGKSQEAAEDRMEEVEELHCITDEDFANSQNTINHKLETVGQWEPWHTMTRDERRAYIQSWLEVQPQNDFDMESKLDTGPPPPARLSDDERIDFHDLLTRMLVWDPEKRLTIEQILGHPWLHRRYDDLEDAKAWIERYNTGQTNWDIRNYHQSCSSSVTGAEVKHNRCPPELWGAIFGYDENGEPINPYADEATASPDVVEQPEESGESEEYFVTRLLGLPMSPQETIEEDTKIVTKVDTKALPETAGVSQRGNPEDNNESSITHLPESLIPTQEHTEDDETITPEVSEIFSETIPQSDGGSDATEYSTINLQGPTTPHQEIVEYYGFITKD